MLHRTLFSNRRDQVVSTAALATIAACTVVITSMVCTAQPQANNVTGQARVVERNGPEVDLQAGGQGGQIVVLFPQAAGGASSSSAAAGDVEIVMVESNMPAPQAAGSDGQPQQPQGNQQPTATGREFLFSSRDANEGVVRLALDAGSGNGRRLKILARVGNEYVQAQQVGGSNNVHVFVVNRPVQQQQQQQQPTNSGDANAGGGEQQAQDGQQQQQQQQQSQQPQVPAPAAIITLYAGASGS